MIKYSKREKKRYKIYNKIYIFRRYKFLYRKYKNLYKYLNIYSHKIKFIYKFFKLVILKIKIYLKKFIKFLYFNLSLKKIKNLTFVMCLKYNFILRNLFYYKNLSILKFLLLYKNVLEYYNNCRNNYMDLLRKYYFKERYLKYLFIKYYYFKYKYNQRSFIVKLKKKVDNSVVIKGYNLKENKIYNYNSYLNNNYNYIFYFLYFIYIFFLSLFLYWFNFLYYKDKKNIYIKIINSYKIYFNKKIQLKKKRKSYIYKSMYTYISNNILVI